MNFDIAMREMLKPLMKECLSEIMKDAIKQALEDIKQLQPERELTRAQIKEEYGVSYPTIHNKMNSKELTFYRKGGKVFFMQSDVDAIFRKKNGKNKELKIVQ